MTILTINENSALSFTLSYPPDLIVFLPYLTERLKHPLNILQEKPTVASVIVNLTLSCNILNLALLGENPYFFCVEIMDAIFGNAATKRHEKTTVKESRGGRRSARRRFSAIPLWPR